MILSLIIMIGSLVSMFTHTEYVHVATFVFVLSAILGTSSLLAVSK
jgi:hypothetical protein